jgi:hypothetical protein
MAGGILNAGGRMGTECLVLKDLVERGWEERVFLMVCLFRLS